MSAVSADVPLFAMEVHNEPLLVREEWTTCKVMMIRKKKLQAER